MAISLSFSPEGKRFRRYAGRWSYHVSRSVDSEGYEIDAGSDREGKKCDIDGRLAG